MLLLLAGIAFGMLVIERMWPGNALPQSRYWWLRIALVNIVQLGIVLLAGWTWDQWLARVSMVRIGDYMGDIPAAIVAYIFSTFIYYWWHRVRHESGFFWRLCHQMHHSPRRIEVLASFYKHPVEIFLNSILSAFLVFAVLGCTVEVAAIYTAITAVAEYFYHWNIRTPRWIGWLIQRPESHRVHHQRNHHSQNYADLPVWDWMFGTLKNPRTSPAHCGFTPEREQMLGAMLACRDVHSAKPKKSLPINCMGCRKRWACYAGKA